MHDVIKKLKKSDAAFVELYLDDHVEWPDGTTGQSHATVTVLLGFKHVLKLKKYSYKK